jgi:adenylate cyclase
VAEDRVTRRLAAILAADVVGFSRLVGEDEEGTIARLQAIRRDVIDPSVERDRGRIVKTMGDGLLIEFPSVVDAVRNAVEVQSALAQRNANLPPARRMEFRIGINLGDIVMDGDDILGDGVNIAARIEALAEPGGISIARAAFDQVDGKLDLNFEDMGEHDVKNIRKPVQVYRVKPDLEPPAGNAPPDDENPLALPDKPSIAVLPFEDMSADKDQEYFADGIVEDIITGLSRIKWLFVIARASTSGYRGQSVDVTQAGRDLGVRYLLEGSVRKAGNRVRITAQLIDATSGEHVWADRYDGAMDDIFDLQDEITTNVIGAVEPSLRQAEIDRAKRERPDNLDAYDLYLRALPHAYANSPDEGRQALKYLDEALRLDPTFASAHGIAAWCNEQLYFRAGLHDENKKAALEHAAEAIAHGNDDSTALCMAGFTVAMVGKDAEAGINAIDRSLALNESFANGFAFSSLIRALTGRYDTAIEHGLRAIRLSPLDPMGGQPYVSLTCAYLPLGRYEEAADAASKAIQLNPKFSWARAIHIVSMVKLGRMDAARDGVRRLLDLMPFTTQMVALPLLGQDINDDWVDALRQVGVPD